MNEDSRESGKTRQEALLGKRATAKERTLPLVAANLVFLPRESGGRKSLPKEWKRGEYRPHLVVASSEADLTGAMPTDDYLGVRFIDGPDGLQFDEPGRFILELSYYPRIDYSHVQVGATISIREGWKTVAVGRVVRRVNLS